MIIPTFRIGDRSAYAAMARCYEEQGIGTLRVNMVRESMEVYCEEIAYFRSRMKMPLEIMADIPLPAERSRIFHPKRPEGVLYGRLQEPRGRTGAGNGGYSSSGRVLSVFCKNSGYSTKYPGN